METVIRFVRTWKGGPLRQMSTEKFSGSIPFAKEIDGMSQAGRYVCTNCLEPVAGGVKLVDTSKDKRLNKDWATAWLCDECIDDPHRVQKSAEEREKVAERLRQIGLRLAAARTGAIVAQNASI